jgi:phage terminase large subunit-like protein
MILDTGGPWDVEVYFLEVAGEIFSGIPEVWLDVPEGNAKTTNMAGFALYHADYTPSAYVPMAASSRDQTGVLLRQAAGFVYRTPGLKKRFRVYEGYRRINALRTGGQIQVFAADDRTGDGVIFTLALLEELHRHPDLRLYRTWHGKLDKRGGQIVAISTAGEPGSEYETTKDEILSTAEVTRDGCHTIARTPELVLHQHALRSGENVHDLKLVKQANPFSGVTVDGLKRKHDSPTMRESHWARFVCGVASRTEDPAIAPEEWSGLPRTILPAGVRVWAGADLGWKWDTSAVAPLWLPDPEDLDELDEGIQRRVFGKPEIVVPPRNGTSTPPGQVRAAFKRVHRRNPIHTVVIDPNAGGEQLVEWIQKPHDPELPDDSDQSGLGAEVIAYSQTNEPAALAYERWMEGMRTGLIEHPHDPVFNQHVLNAIAKPVLGNREKFDRPRATRQARGQDRRVIDALTAASNVHAVAIGEGDEEPPPFDLSNYRIGVL